MSWSYSALVKEHGEEKALLLLYEQTGFGQFGGPVKTDTRKYELPDRCPLCGEQWSSKKSCGRPA